MLDLQTQEVVSDLTDGNEQLSVMRYSPGQITRPKLLLESCSSHYTSFVNMRILCIVDIRIVRLYKVIKFVTAWFKFKPGIKMEYNDSDKLNV